MLCWVFKMPADPTPNQGSCLHSRQWGREWGGNCSEAAAGFPPEQGQDAETQDRESPWGTHGTEEHCATHPWPRRSQAWKRSQNGVKGHSTPHGATASLQGPARGMQATGPVPAANNGETGDTGQLCPREPQSLYPPHPGCTILRNCIGPAPVGLVRWHVRGLEAPSDALASL